MTREEAKRILYVYRAVNLVDASHREAFDMAIKALEQEPCEDAISRANTIYEVSRIINDHPLDGYEDGQLILKTIQDMPPVTPAGKQEPYEDAISRQAVDKLFSDAYESKSVNLNEDWKKLIWIREHIKELPSVTPAGKVGKWIYGEDNLGGTGRDGWYCNQCGHFEFWDYSMDMKSAKLNLPNLCPNCYCKMQEVEDADSD